MGIYNELLTTKTIRVKLPDGSRETVNTYRCMGKQSHWDKARPWEQALIQRMENIFYERGYPKYVCGDDPGEGWPVYERVEQTYFTDEYPSKRILAGFLRKGDGKMLHFDKWQRVMIDITDTLNSNSNIYESSIQQDISGKLRESGVISKFQTSTFNERHDGRTRTFVVLYSPNEHDIAMMKVVLAGEYTFAEG